MSLFVSGEFGDRVKSGLQIRIRGDIVVHFSIVILLIGQHIKIAGTSEAKEDGLFLPCFLAFQRLIYGSTDGVAALRSRQNAFRLSKVLCRLKHRRLLVKLGQEAGSTAMIR